MNAPDGNPPTGPLAAVKHDFPGWNIFSSRGARKRYWASRRGANRDKPDELPFDESVTWAMTVDGDTPADLRDAIAAQEASSEPP